jgi:prepilin signal peptidase PulO-like enzyme (type II secretory pathway)
VPNNYAYPCRITRSPVMRIDSYSFKVWLTGAILPPILMFFYGLFRNTQNIEAIGIIMVMMLFGCIFSFPSLACFYLVTYYLKKYLHPIAVIKLYLSLISILLTLIPFWFFAGFELKRVELILLANYYFSILLGIWVFKLKSETLPKATESTAG